jgi:hypothetical protein
MMAIPAIGWLTSCEADLPGESEDGPAWRRARDSSPILMP